MDIFNKRGSTFNSPTVAAAVATRPSIAAAAARLSLFRSPEFFNLYVYSMFALKESIKLNPVHGFLFFIEAVV
ncbi:hypothetical protein KY285_027083 [Solanum tuberosum]|nr:hypothetical protein KY285_027083 [Solanum tuberosum]